MAKIDYLVAESFNAYADSGAPLRLSGTLRERPDPAGKAGAYYFATDQGIVFESTGKAWIVRGALGKDDVAGRASGLSTDMPPAGKMVGWIFHTTDTNRDYEAFPSGWYTTIPVNPFTEPDIAPDSLATLRSSISNQFGARCQSTEDATPLTRIIMQTLDASPKNPYRVKFDHHILEAFTGDGQFDIVERDSVRRSFGGISDGTAALSDPSGVMNWQPEDEGKVIKVGRGSGFQLFRIESVEDEETVTLDRETPGSATGVALEMEGGNAVTIATKNGFTNGIDNENGWQSFAKIITTDKVYSLVFVPGDTGDGVISLSAEALVGKQPALGVAGVSGFELDDATYPGQNDASFNIDPQDMMIGALITASALGMVGIGVYFFGATAIAAGGTTLVEGVAAPATEVFTYELAGETITLTLPEVESAAAPTFTIAARLEVLADVAQSEGLGGQAAGYLGALAAGVENTYGVEAAALITLSEYGIPSPLDVDHGNHGTYLHYFVYPHGVSEGTPPGFPGFPGSNGPPLGPGVFKICYTNDTPDGGPPICYFVQ